MTKFVIQPHGRLQEWIAHEKGYFHDEGLDYEFVPGASAGKPKVIDGAGKVVELRSGAFEVLQVGGRQQGREVGYLLRVPLGGEPRRGGQDRHDVSRRLRGDAWRNHGAAGFTDPSAGSIWPGTTLRSAIIPAAISRRSSRSNHSCRARPSS